MHFLKCRSVDQESSVMIVVMIYVIDPVFLISLHDEFSALKIFEMYYYKDIYKLKSNKFF